PATEIVEENNYYPFGLKHEGYNDLPSDGYKYKLLNREYEDSFGLNVTETDYRQYDAALGRFNVMDALSEMAPDHTPYRYGFNNPVVFSDPLGLFESYETAEEYRKSNKLFGATIEFDSDSDLWKIIDGDSTITQVGKKINTMYMMNGEMYLEQTDAGGGGSGNESSWKAKLSADFTNSYSSSGLRYFVDWWKYNDLAGGTGGLVINGISTYNMGSAEIEGPYKQINVTDLPGFTGPGQNLTQKITEALTKLASLNEDSNIRSWVLGKEKDPYVTYETKRYFISGKPAYSDYVEIYGISYDTVIKSSMSSTLDRKKEADSIRLLPIRNNFNDSVRNTRR